MPLRCPKCFSGDFYITGRDDVDTYHCRACGYAGNFFPDFRDDTAIPALRTLNHIPPPPEDATDFSRTGVIALAVLVALFLCLMYIVLGPHR